MMQFTRMLWRASIIASDFVSEMTAALAAAYGKMWGAPRRAVPEPRLMITPPPCSIIGREAARAQ